MSILGEITVVRVRRTAGAVASTGRRAAPTESETEILANFQPLPGDVLLSLPEGDRQRGGYLILTESEVRTANQHDQVLADLIEVDGVRYEVRQVEHYNSVFPHYEAVIVRLQEA